MYKWCCYRPYYYFTKGSSIEVDLKYGNRDITSGSLVFRSSKGYEACGDPLPEFIYTPNLKVYTLNVKI